MTLENMVDYYTNGCDRYSHLHWKGIKHGKPYASHNQTIHLQRQIKCECLPECWRSSVKWWCPAKQCSFMWCKVCWVVYIVRRPWFHIDCSLSVSNPLTPHLPLSFRVPLSLCRKWTTLTWTVYELPEAWHHSSFAKYFFKDTDYARWMFLYYFIVSWRVIDIRLLINLLSLLHKLLNIVRPNLWNCVYRFLMGLQFFTIVNFLTVTHFLKTVNTKRNRQTQFPKPDSVGKISPP